ncbi:hypothetical protein HDU76_001906 [Blyttiomyces sp. JEL0837]|nr:hypothetical protein HDU76_001906 [Blyttiomyces sp. JEL0837]
MTFNTDGRDNHDVDKDARLLFITAAVPVSWALISALIDLISATYGNKASKSQGGAYPHDSTTQPLLNQQNQENSSYHSTITPHSNGKTNPSKSTFPDLGNNTRYKWLDSGISALLVSQILVSGFALGAIISDSTHHDESNGRFVDLVSEGLWALTWISTLTWLNLIVRKNSTLGHGFTLLYLMALIARGIQLNSISTTTTTPHPTQFDSIYPLLSFTLLIPLLALECIQRYWQATPISPIRNTTSRIRAARKAAKERNNAYHVNTDEGVSVDDNDEDVDNPEDETSPNFVREPCRYPNASLISKLTFSWADALFFKAYRGGLESEDIWDLDEEERSKVTLRKWEPYKRSNKSLFWSLFDFFKVPFLTCYFISLFSAVLDLVADGYVYFNQRKASIRLRSTLISEIYGKAMRRAAGAVKPTSSDEQQQQKASIGKIVSLMSSEVNRIYGFYYQAHSFLGEIPFHALISVIALFIFLGPSAFAGLVTLILTSPIGGKLSTMMMTEQTEYSNAMDLRTQAVNEALQGIRIIKYFAWESTFFNKINETREKELKKIKNMWLYFLGFWGLDAATAFTSLTLLKIVSESLNMLPMIGMNVTRAKASFERVAAFLEEDELDKYESQAGTVNGATEAVRSSVGVTTLSNESTPLLGAAVVNIVEEEDGKPKVELPEGYVKPLVGIYKAEFEYHGGNNKKSIKTSARTGSISFFNTALDFINNPYERVKSLFVRKDEPATRVEASPAAPPSSAKPTSDVLTFELRDVTATFPVGCLTTIIGPTGSGKTSMLLALLGEMKRKQGFCFFPDPRLKNPSVAYAAQTAFILNATVRENILFGCEFDEVRYHQVLEACALARDLEILEGGDLTEIGRTCILVTHATYLVLPYSQHTIAMNNGSIAAQGTLEDIMASPDVDITGITREELNDEDSVAVVEGESGLTEFKKKESMGKLTTKKATKIVESEERSRGNVKFSVYLAYIKACGGMVFVAFLAMQAIVYFSSFLNDWWLKVWSEANGVNQNTTSSMSDMNSFDIEPQQSSALYFIGIYALISLISLAIGVTGQTFGFLLSLMASRTIHSNLLKNVLGSPMRFFEKTPVGRLLNRFTKDMLTIDNDCGDCMRDVLSRCVSFLINIIVIAIVVPGSWAFVPILFVCFYWVAAVYNATSRELKRLESVAASPIYAQFSETLNGVSTIRAYGAESLFQKKCEEKVDNFHRNTPGWAGLTLTYAFETTMGVIWIIRIHASTDMAMNAVERVEEYSTLEQEPPAIVNTYRPSPSWPNTGAIQVRNLTVRYGPSQPAVLKNLNFNIRPSEKVGVVGRTGAGKSTLTLAFFRILADIEGSIVIDDMDIFKMGLKDLRSKLTIIPQDPVLFEGTLRFNLDPVGMHNDGQLWDAIKAVGLIESMQQKSDNASTSSSSISTAMPIEDTTETKTKVTISMDKPAKETSDEATGLSLDSEITESGGNFSQGQRQLICMARALLRDSKVFFLDEATASVDEAADANIQRIIRSAFKDGTVITIAHRIKTIVDYDRVMVLDRGEIVEFDEPVKLLAKEEGVFKKMCEESGDYADLVSAATAKKSKF